MSRVHSPPQTAASPLNVNPVTGTPPAVATTRSVTATASRTLSGEPTRRSSPSPPMRPPPVRGKATTERSGRVRRSPHFHAYAAGSSRPSHRFPMRSSASNHLLGFFLGKRLARGDLIGDQIEFTRHCTSVNSTGGPALFFVHGRRDSAPRVKELDDRRVRRRSGALSLRTDDTKSASSNSSGSPLGTSTGPPPITGS